MISHTKDIKRPKKEADTFRLVGGGFNKQRKLCTNLVLGSGRMSRSLHLIARIMSIYKGLSGVQSCIQSDGLKSTLLSPDCVLEVAPNLGNMGRMYLPRTGPDPVGGLTHDHIPLMNSSNRNFRALCHPIAGKAKTTLELSSFTSYPCQVRELGI